MTEGELKAYIEGMDVKEAPTPEQWTKLMAQIKKLKTAEPQIIPYDTSPRYMTDYTRLADLLPTSTC